MKNKKKKSNFWKWIFWIVIILIILNIYMNQREEWKKENCDLTFSTYTYNSGCATACSIKCSNEGFTQVSSSYFDPYLSAKEMDDWNLYKKCTCDCGGCRER